MERFCFKHDSRKWQQKNKRKTSLKEINALLLELFNRLFPSKYKT